MAAAAGKMGARVRSSAGWGLNRVSEVHGRAAHSGRGRLAGVHAAGALCCQSEEEEEEFFLFPSKFKSPITAEMKLNQIKYFKGMEIYANFYGNLS